MSPPKPRSDSLSEFAKQSKGQLAIASGMVCLVDMALHGTAWHCMALHGTAWHMAPCQDAFVALADITEMHSRPVPNFGVWLKFVTEPVGLNRVDELLHKKARTLDL